MVKFYMIFGLLIKRLREIYNGKRKNMKNLADQKIFEKNIENKKPKILQYIDDHRIVYDGKKATKAETEAAAKRIDSYKNQMSKTDEYNIYFNKKSPQYYNKKVVKKPRPNIHLNNPLSNTATDNFLELVDPGGWADEKKAQVEENLFEKYLELLKGGELQPGTTFKMFEKNYHDFDTDIISKIKKEIDKRIAAAKKSDLDKGLAALLRASPGRLKT